MSWVELRERASKWEVWEAYERVEVDKGVPGVDGCSIEESDADLKNNLYKIWKRMSSGCYFPPPMRAVEVVKPHGGEVRVLAVPIVADRIAQTVVTRRLEGRSSQSFIPFLRLPSGPVATDAVAACRKRCWKTDWGDRFGHPDVLRQIVTGQAIHRGRFARVPTSSPPSAPSSTTERACAPFG